MGNYSIVDIEDFSWGDVKRFSANIVLRGTLSKLEISQVIVEATKEIVKDRGQVYVVWLLIYLDGGALERLKWICRTQWIDASLPEEKSPDKMIGNGEIEGIVVDWKNNKL